MGSSSKSPKAQSSAIPLARLDKDEEAGVEKRAGDSSFGGGEDKMIRDNKKTPPKNKEAQNLEQMLGCAPGKMKGGMEINKQAFIHVKIPRGNFRDMILGQKSELLRAFM